MSTLWLSNAREYFVDSTLGDDTNSGRHPSQPWRTIAKVNASSFNADDRIYFKRNGIWREQLNIPSSGVIIDNYGDSGSLPRILGSEQLTGWTADTGHWVCDYVGTVEPVWFINASDGKTKWGNKQASKAACVSEYDWYSDGTSVWCYAATDPDSRYTSVEAATRSHCLDTVGARSYITITDIEFAYSMYFGIRNVYSGTTDWMVDGCTIHHIGVQNSNIAAEGIQSKASNSLYQNNIVYDAGNHGISIFQNNATTTQNVTVRNNTLYNCYHTGIDIMGSGTGSLLTGVNVLYNFIYTDADYANFNLTMQGISVIGSSGTPVGQCTNTTVAYNIVLNPVSCGIYSQWPGTSDLYIYNNLVYGKNPLSGLFSAGIFIQSDVVSATLKNNIAVDGDSACFLIGNINNIVACDYNCWYQTAGGTKVYVGFTPGADYHFDDFAAYKAATGWDTNGFWEDPVLVNLGGTTAEDYKLDTGSPLIDQGVDVSQLFDYWGTSVPQGSAPDIGAHEYT